MDIAFAFDARYADATQVAMESVLDSHPGRTDLRFWLLTTARVAEERGGALARQVAGRAAMEIRTLDEGFQALPVSQRDCCRYISAGMYLRLFLPTLVDPSVERLLYLDGDVLVHGDLSALWDEPLGAAPLAAVRDSLARSVDYEGGIPGAGDRVRPGAAYFNSGVLLMNLPAWRAAGVTEACLEYLTVNRDRLRYPDQDALNLVCHTTWRRLKPIWNDTVLWWLRAEEHVEVRQTVRISHFVGQFKPWDDEFPFVGYRDRYRELAARLPGVWVPGPAAPFPDPSTMEEFRHDLLTRGPWRATVPRSC